MKKPLLVLLLCLCCAPCFSQGVKAGLQGIKTGVKGVSAAGQIEKNLAQQVRRACANSLVTAYVTNLPGKPTVFVLPEQPTVGNNPASLSVRVPKPMDLYGELSYGPLPRLRMPASFANREEPVVFRGMRIKGIDELKNILNNGLEINKTHYKGIYVSRAPNVALSYAVPSFDAALYASELQDYFELPVVVKISSDWQTLREALLKDSEYMVLDKDIPASKILDVMVLLEMDGQTDWYKTTLENNELVFKKVPSTAVPGWLMDF